MSGRLRHRNSLHRVASFTDGRNVLPCVCIPVLSEYVSWFVSMTFVLGDNYYGAVQDCSSTSS